MLTQTAKKAKGRQELVIDHHKTKSEQFIHHSLFLITKIESKTYGFLGGRWVEG